MPVLMKDSLPAVSDSSSMWSTTNFDVDNLISDVRERLCLKSHASSERTCSSSSSSRRNAPYQLSHHRHRLTRDFCEKCRSKHFSSPNPFQQSRAKTDSFFSPGMSGPGSKSMRSTAISREVCCSCRRITAPREKMCSPSKMPRKCHSASKDQDPHLLLEKLIAEQSLIQEAVRRIQRRSTDAHEETGSSSTPKLFSSLVPPDMTDEDSNDQFSDQQTPFSLLSESEDDAVSQHSIDL